MKATVNSDDYRTAHGKPPCGEGVWTFYAIACRPGCYTQIGPYTVPGVFATARKQAVEMAKAEARGISGVNEVHLEVKE